jgi:DNA invertase Pin-like site-specific DNA recombinase
MSAFHLVKMPCCTRFRRRSGYYSNLIQSRADWAFAGVYADEATTGTKDERAEFQRLLTDCRAGKIDLIITKSITRFARNTVILLETVRDLKLLNIDVYFEEQNIHSLSGDGELMLTILASYAQEESRSVSENCKWRIRRDFQQGRPNIGRMLGYRLRDGQFHTIPEEAELVCRIFADYLAGMGVNAIVNKLNHEGILSPMGRRWGVSSVAKILRNEKYTGNMMLQKTFVEDHISKKKRDNHGELPRYFIENCHEAIIDQRIFNEVQLEIVRRAAKHQPNPKTPSVYPFTGLLTCGKCGARYRRKHTNAGSKYEKIVWICPTFNMKGKSACASQQIPEDILNAKTMEAGGFDGLKEIRVPDHNLLSFIYSDRQVDLTWKNSSRRDSWTPKMREDARQNSLERRSQK